MRTFIQKLVVGSLLLWAGMVVGLVISGRFSLTEPSTAAPTPAPLAPAPQTRPATAAAAASQGGVLPNLSDIAERALKVSANITSTVTQRMNDPMARFFYGTDMVQSDSAGSGVVVTADGYILTNKHVIGSRDAEIKVTLADGVPDRPARIVGLDEVSDLAVIKVDAKNLDTLPWGDSTKLRVAEWVLAIGNPFQLSGTVTLGIVSTVSRPGPYTDFIQTDAAINPGNSGGALVNARGELVGINTQIVTETGGYQGIGLAIPSSVAVQVFNDLKNNGKVVRGSIGMLNLRNIDAAVAEANGLGRVGGVLIYNIYDRRSPAARAGLQRFDIITAVNGQAVRDDTQLMKAIYFAKVGSTVQIDLMRRGRRVSVDVAVEELTGR